eukprot:g14165.t1
MVIIYFDVSKSVHAFASEMYCSQTKPPEPLHTRIPLEHLHRLNAHPRPIKGMSTYNPYRDEQHVPEQATGWSKPFKALGGMLMATAFAAGAGLRSIYTGGRVQNAQPHFFLPKDGVDKVLVTGASLSPLNLIQRLGGASAIYVATNVPPPQLDSGKAVPGWVYGASSIEFAGKTIPVPTGSPGDVLRGTLLTWPGGDFAAALKTADDIFGGMRRGIVNVVKEDGTAEKAYWYYQDGTAEKAYWYYQKAEYPIVGPESIMSQKDHGTCPTAVQKPLRWHLDNDLADRICCFNRHYAEHSGFFTLQREFLDEVGNSDKINFYDPVTGDHLFTAPIGRSWNEFLVESQKHGWPSFRDEEVVWDNVRCLRNGEAVSVSGTHLGHNIPDGKGNRYCINLVSVAGNPP